MTIKLFILFLLGYLSPATIQIRKMNIAGNNSNSMPTGFLMVLVLVEIESFYVTVCSLDLDSFKNMFEISCKKKLQLEIYPDINANSDICHKQIKVETRLKVTSVKLVLFKYVKWFETLIKVDQLTEILRFGQMLRQRIVANCGLVSN